MNIVPVDRSMDVFWKELFYVKARLKSSPKTEGLVPMVDGLLVLQEDLFRADREVQGELLESQALAQSVEDMMQAETIALYLLALTEVQKNKKDPRYEKLIKLKESVFLRMGFSSQREEIMRMKSVLKQSIYDDGDFRTRAFEILDRMVAGLDKAMATSLAAEEKRAQHRVDVEAWKNEANSVRLDIYGELLQLGGSKAKAWARSFFPKANSGKKLSALELAELEAKREQKRAKKAAEQAEYRRLKQEQAEDKARLEKKKKEAEDEMRAEAKLRVAERERKEREERERKEREEREKQEKEKAEREAAEAKKLEEEERLRQLQQSEEPAPM